MDGAEKMIWTILGFLGTITVMALMMAITSIFKKKQFTEKDGVKNMENKQEEFIDKKMCELSPCPKCKCMTKSIRQGRASYYCGKCRADKSLSDVYFYEATHKDASVAESEPTIKDEMKKEIDKDYTSSKESVK